MAKPNPGQSRGNVSSRTKSYTASVDSLPAGCKTHGGAKGMMNTTPKASAGQVKGKST